MAMGRAGLSGVPTLSTNRSDNMRDRRRAKRQCYVDENASRWNVSKTECGQHATSDQFAPS
eukprot:1213870-Pyramimonas_sp.AAC.1